MKVLIVSQYFPSESSTVAATVAQDMAYRGHDVRVLVGSPSYSYNKVFDGDAQNWRQFERHGDVDVLRAPLHPGHSLTRSTRTANYASVALSAATARDFTRGADVIYVYAPQMTPVWRLWLRWILGGAPYVLHMQDLHPGSSAESSSGSSSRAGKAADTALSLWLRGVYRRAAGVIGTTPSMVDALIGRGAHKERTSLVFNWASEDDPSERRERPAGDPRVRFLYAGTMDDRQDVEAIVRAAKLAEDAPVKVTVVGGGAAEERAKRIAAALDVRNVEFRDLVPAEEMAEVYADADFSLITSKDLPDVQATIPPTFQSSMAAGLPVVTTAQGDLHGLVDDLGLGFTADAEDPESLAQAMRSAAALVPADYDALRLRTRDTYDREFSAQPGLDAIENALFKAAESRKMQYS